jgi:tRNA-dihydrouridine synthase B
VPYNSRMFRIGDVQLASNLLLCPIAGYCDLPFRLTVRPLGGLALASSDLINPRGLMRQTRKSMELVETDPADHPLCIQLYGIEPDEMANAAQWCEENGAVVIDINMGCPVDKVCKTNGGSALLRNPQNAVAIAGKVVRAVRAPVTVKMRLGWDDDNIVAPLLAPAFEDVGVAALTIHGRTASQKFSGQARREGIARVVESVKRIPVIGNGDIRSPQDAEAMMRDTGCAAVMIGRAALSDPWIFRDTHAYLMSGQIPPPPTPAERIALMTTHFENVRRIRGDRRACITIRQRVSWYARKLPPCREFLERMRTLAVAADYYDHIEFLNTQITGERVRRTREVA